MEARTPGIHHITAISGDPQRTVDFYAGILGLRLVKKTVNYDDPGCYHLYFGNRAGSPGGILTFFPWDRDIGRSRRFSGQVGSIAFSLPSGSIGFWQQRLESAAFCVSGPVRTDDGTSLKVIDPDGLSLELIDAGEGAAIDAWDERVPSEHAILGFHSVLLTVRRPDITARILRSALGFRCGEERGGEYRMITGVGTGSTVIGVVSDEGCGSGRVGAGAIHHIAWRAADDSAQADLRAQIVAEGMDATPVLDRTYFKSVYFREPGGILFEIATDKPGFSVDEPVESLGQRLSLPSWLETERAVLEDSLVPLREAQPK